MIQKNFDLKEDDLRYLSEFYFDGRYPGTDYLVATKEDAVKAYEIIQDIKEEVDGILGSQTSVVLKKIETFE